MGNVLNGGSRPEIKERLPEKLVRFSEGHPLFVKAYVPVMVTLSVAVQLITGCGS